MQSEKTTILVVDDEAAMREVLETRLRHWGYDVCVAADGQAAQRVCEAREPDLVLSDVSLPDVSGLTLLEKLAGTQNRPVLLMTAFGNIDVAVDAMKRGARDFFTKPLDYERLKATVLRLEREVEFRRATDKLEAGLARQDGLGALLGASPKMRELFDLLRTLAPTDASVIITGESGTGKEVVARTLHALSRRSQKPFVALNTAALPEGLVEAELFGHERGSFTGAVASRPGCFELADGGTLFLDEIAEMPMSVQPKLLRVLEDGSFRPVGGKGEIKVDTRILAATNRAPLEAMAQGLLREDLYYRLNVFNLVLPPLRERKDDIALLAQHFAVHFNKKHGTRTPGLSDEAVSLLVQHAWPGNVRELRNVIERAVILAQEAPVGAAHLPPQLQTTTKPVESEALGVVLPASVTAAEAERILIMETLRQVSNNKAAAARRLGMDVKTIRNKLKTYGVTAEGE